MNSQSTCFGSAQMSYSTNQCLLATHCLIYFPIFLISNLTSAFSFEITLKQRLGLYPTCSSQL